VRLRTGAAEQALELFDRVLTRRPTDADALDGRGVALDLLDRPAEAQQAYLAARAVAPADLRIAGNLAFSFLLEGRAREARDVLEPFAGRSDMPTRMRTSLAIARAMTGDREGAAGLLGPDVTQQDLDQLVASLPASRPARAAPVAAAPAPARAAAPGAAPAVAVAAQPAMPAESPADAAPDAAFRPFDEVAPAPPRAAGRDRPRRPAGAPAAN
jgi:tetratricopeptide (TPR) repeat protein